MLEELMKMIQQQGQQAVVANPEVPNEHNEAVMQEASSSIMSGMTQMFQQGGPGALKSLFEGVQSGDSNNPAVQQLSSGFEGNIMEKFGISGGTAKTIAASLIPVVLGKLMNQAKDANGSGFDIGSILGSLTGGNPAATGAGAPAGGGDMMSTLSSLGASLGLDKNGDGKTDLSDLMKMFGK